MKTNEERTFFILLFDASMYAAFCACWDVNTTIPIFLDFLKCPPWLIGCAATIKQLGYVLPQLVIAAQFRRVKELIAFLRKIMLLDRPQLLIFAILLYYLQDRDLLIILFFFSFSLVCIGEGALLVPWVELMSIGLSKRTTEPFWGVVQCCGGVASLAAGLLVAKLLFHPQIPTLLKYNIIFGAGALMMQPSFYLFRFISEPATLWTNQVPLWRTAFANCLSNREFIWLIIIQHLSGYDALVLPYYLITIRHQFSWSISNTGTYIILSIVGGIIGGILWSSLIQRIGAKGVVALALLCKFVTCSIFFVGIFCQPFPGLPFLFDAGFLFAGISTTSWVGFMNYLLKLAASFERRFFLSLSNTLLLPLALFPMVGGLAIHKFGYLWTFGLAAAATGIGCFLAALRLVPEK